MNINFRTCNHLGDTLCLSGAMWNLHCLHPDWHIGYEGNYADVFQHTIFAKGIPAEYVDRRIYSTYRKWADCGQDGHRFSVEQNASAGSLTDGLTMAISLAIQEEIPLVTRAPHIEVTEEELLRWLTYAGCWILNSNCQDNSTVKAYPFWQEVVDLCKVKNFILIGSREDRDIRQEVTGENVIDLRGKTGIRDLIALVALADGVVTPPSAVCHIAGGLGIKSVILTGAREPIKFTDYPEAVHLTSTCGRFSKDYGCIHFRTEAGSCERHFHKYGRNYAQCMADVKPMEVALEILA